MRGNKVKTSQGRQQEWPPHPRLKGADYSRAGDTLAEITAILYFFYLRSSMSRSMYRSSLFSSSTSADGDQWNCKRGRNTASKQHKQTTESHTDLSDATKQGETHSGPVQEPAAVIRSTVQPGKERKNLPSRAQDRATPVVKSHQVCLATWLKTKPGLARFAAVEAVQ